MKEFVMSGFFKSVLGIAALSTAMIAGMGSSNEAEARPWGGYGGGYRGGYGGYRGGYGVSVGPVYYGSGYRYNSYRPYYGGYNNYYGNGYYGRPYGYNSYYGPRNVIGVGPVRVGF